MKYLYRCTAADDRESYFEVEAPMAEGPPHVVYCPTCSMPATRVYTAPPIKWNTSGAHGRAGHYQGDYDSKGDKLERLNANWSKATGQKPPPPASDVPKNSSDPY
jgi:predicted nucleic acid-binding Zn ribbon protein